MGFGMAGLAKSVIEWAGVAAAVVAAAVAVYQAYDASKSSNSAQQAALANQRLGVCLAMNANSDEMFESTTEVVLVKKPYNKNPNFMKLAAQAKSLMGNANLFRQMTPGEESKLFLQAVYELSISLGDMVLDGGDYLSQDQIMTRVVEITRSRQTMCDRLFKA